MSVPIYSGMVENTKIRGPEKKVEYISLSSVVMGILSSKTYMKHEAKSTNMNVTKMPPNDCTRGLYLRAP